MAKCNNCGAELIDLFTSVGVCPNDCKIPDIIVINGIKFKKIDDGGLYIEDTRVRDGYHVSWDGRAMAVIKVVLEKIIDNNNSDHKVDLGGIWIKYSPVTKTFSIENKKEFGICYFTFSYNNMLKIIDFLKDAP